MISKTQDDALGVNPPPAATSHRIQNGLDAEGETDAVALFNSDLTAAEREMSELRRRLSAATGRLESILQPQGAAGEGLESVRREIQLSNEQLQKSNEMLEACRETIESTRELLHAVHLEMQYRGEQLARLNDDVSNLLRHANEAVAMIGADLRVRHFTPPASATLGLTAGDLGRSIAHLKLKVDVGELERAMVAVMNSEQPREDRMKGDGGRWMTVHTAPYRTADHRTDGVVLTVVEAEDVHAEGDGNERSAATGKGPAKKRAHVSRR